MKIISSLLLTASLALNLVLLYFVTRPDSATDNAAIQAAAGNVAANPAVTDNAHNAIRGTAWLELDSADLNALANRLRAENFPPELVRAIVTAQVNDAFAARRRALDGDINRPYWKAVPVDRATRAAQAELRREQRLMLREILGEDPEDTHPLNRIRAAREYGHLPTDKANAVRDIVREFDERRRDLFESAGNIIDGEQMTAFESQRLEAIRAVLSPEEFLEYELRASRVAQSLVRELAAFNPSEEEFRKIFSIRKEFDEKYRFGGRSTPEEMRARAEAQRQVQQGIIAALGPERASQYERMTDGSYRLTSQLVSRLQLPPETTDQLYALQKEFEQRRGETSRGVTDAEEMTRRLTALQNEATEKLAAVLRTPEAVEAYQQYGGMWLRSLAPPTRR